MTDRTDAQLLDTFDAALAARPSGEPMQTSEARALRAVYDLDRHIRPDGIVPPQMQADAERHARGMEVARRWAQWHIGDPAWASGIIDAYLDPDRVSRELDEETR